MNAMGDNRFIIQPFIDYQFEHRVLVLKGKIIGTLLRRIQVNTGSITYLMPAGYKVQTPTLS